VVAFRPDSFGLWYYKVSKIWSVIFLGPKIFGLWWSAVVCGGLWWSVVFRQTVSNTKNLQTATTAPPAVRTRTNKIQSTRYSKDTADSESVQKTFY